MTKPIHLQVWAFVFVLFTAWPVAAQFTLTASSVEGAPGSVVEVSVALDNDEEIYGFSMGIAHDAAMLALDDIVQGGAISPTNSGLGAEFFQVNLSPEHGPGGTVGCIISTDSPLETLEVGSDQELVRFVYTIEAGATIGSTADLEFTDGLGDPTVRTIVSDGTSYVPSKVNGGVLILTPPVAALECSLADPCDCGALLEWSNVAAYDSITIERNGEEIASIAGTATSYTTPMSGPGTDDFAVIPVVGLLTGEAALCSVECPAEPATPASPANFACKIQDNCDVFLTWTNTDSYDQLQVLVDGEILDTLEPDAEVAMLNLGDTEEHEICLSGGACDLEFESVCCDIQCALDEPQFKRGDVDGSGAVAALADSMRLLNWAFLGGQTPPCMDAADINDNGAVQPLPDVIALLNYGFLGGAEPKAPGPSTCGVDPTDDSTGCLTESSACD